MRTQCKRIYSALPTQCDRICNGRCETPCVSDASTEIRVKRTEKGEGLSLDVDSPSPYGATHREVLSVLLGGLESLSPNDFGRPWPYPRRDVIARLTAEHDRDLCLQAAREAREIVQAADRAPNVTALFEKKLLELAEVRLTVRDSLAEVAG